MARKARVGGRQLTCPFICSNGEGGMGNGGGGRAVGRLGERDLGIEEGDFNHEWARIFTNGEGGTGNVGDN